VTYSIVGADTTTREVGGAGTSCLTGDDVYIIYGGVPGHGVVHAQAYSNPNGKRRAAELLAQGQAPTDILAAITQTSFDPSVAIRQYGIIDVDGHGAGFTGSGTKPYAGDRQGAAGHFAYAVQGNILTSANVLEHAANAFQAGGCDLAERLMSALEAGAAGGEGDSRCTNQGIPSDSAFLQVESPDAAAGAYLSLRVQSSGSQNPLPLLRAKLDAWREQHPCPVATPSTSAATSQTDESSGCSCRYTGGSSPDTLGALIGGLMIVAWRRQRAPRQLRPVQTP
jgi:MYXO-CTERM domain-containing protein